MTTDWIEANAWNDKGPAASELATIRQRVVALPPDAYGTAVPDLLDYLRLQRRGLAHLFHVSDKVTKYNEASHAQQTKQMEAVRQLIDVMKQQDRHIRTLNKRVDALEKKLAKQAARLAKKF